MPNVLRIAVVAVLWAALLVVALSSLVSRARPSDDDRDALAARPIASMAFPLGQAQFARRNLALDLQAGS